jgi:hypothetical protein
MNGSAGTRGLWRSLRLVGSTVACVALTWGVTIGTVGAQAASATGNAATYRSICPTETKPRQKNARRAEAKTRSRKAHTACRPPVPTGTPPGSTSGGSVGSSPDPGSPDPGTPDPGTPSPPPNTPSFLQGLSKLWADDCSNPDPFTKWPLADMQRKDGSEQDSTSLSQIVPGRFQQFTSGGPGNGPYYRFTAPQGDNIWTPGTDGRSELSLRGSNDFYEGQRKVTLISIRLPAGWNVNNGPWNTLVQWKQNEGKNWTGGSPALSLEQVNGVWGLSSFGSYGSGLIWRMPAQQTGKWVNFAFDITFSADPNKGKVQVHADFDGDGTYEYTSPVIQRQTLLQQQSGSGPGIESHIRAGLYEGVGGDSIEEAGFAIYG